MYDILLHLPIPPCIQNADVIVAQWDHISPYSAQCGTTLVICYYSKYHQRQLNVTSGDRGLPVAELNSILPVSFLGNFLYGKGSILMGILS